MKNKWINTILIIVLTLIALYFNLKDVYKEVLSELSKVNLLFLFMAILLILVYYALDGIVITIMSKPYKKAYSYMDGFKNTLIGGFFSNITPFATGGQVARIYVLSKQGLKSSEATSVLLMNFIVYQITLIVYGLLAIILKFNYFHNNYKSLFYLVLLGFVINGIVITVLLLASKSKKFYNFISNYILSFLHKIKLIKDYEVSKEKFEKQVISFQKEISNLFKNKVLLIKTFIIQIIRLAIFHSIPIFVLKAIDPTISFNMLGQTILLSIFVFNVLATVPIPGDNGISETVYILMYKTMFDTITVSSSMVIWRFICYYFVMIVGGICFALNKNIKNKKEIVEIEYENILDSENEIFEVDDQIKTSKDIEEQN